MFSKKNILLSLTIVYVLVIFVEMYAVFIESRALEKLVKPFLMLLILIKYCTSIKKNKLGIYNYNLAFFIGRLLYYR